MAAFAICRYVEASGDMAVLDEQVTFLQGRQLKADEESYYDLPVISEEPASLYHHGVRAILHGLRFGEQGLPLMGSGDWNDGMNLVGMHGRGESVWLGFFLYTILKSFAVLARRYGDAIFAERCEAGKRFVADNIWSKMAGMVNGIAALILTTVHHLGSANNIECRIDSIAQSWSVLSGAGEPGRGLNRRWRR